MNEYLDMSDDEGMWRMIHISFTDKQIHAVKSLRCCDLLCDVTPPSLTCMFRCMCPNPTVRANVSEILTGEPEGEGICREFASSAVLAGRVALAPLQQDSLRN